jgi:hypothetical protein
LFVCLFDKDGTFLVYSCLVFFFFFALEI